MGATATCPAKPTHNTFRGRTGLDPLAFPGVMNDKGNAHKAAHTEGPPLFEGFWEDAPRDSKTKKTAYFLRNSRFFCT